MTQVQPAPPQSYSRTTWRLLDTGWLDGASNMAIDEAIMQGIAAGESPPTLRFYGWQPPCLSLGYAQPWDVVDEAACRRRGWDVVRRPTGGRAILHIDELTYSICAPEDEERVRGGILHSYRQLSDGLAEGLKLLGLRPSRAQPPDGAAAGGAGKGAACFDRPSNYEITVNGRKLVGSAQARKEGVVLQHGALPLHGDITRIALALAAEDEEQRAAIAAGLLEDAITLEESLGRRAGYEEVADGLARGFAAALNLALEEGGLSDAEQARAATIRAEKYAHKAWTRRL
ncbi:MAG TPA: biotin/lipoate A/B protein ligase family protein [Candidatus Sulfomarinibacteraceae bacterium]|nr:biotin/lipoate A/B protein ligase family protein [Candidatus Sulfomarinibacteraceae bacterium]